MYSKYFSWLNNLTKLKIFLYQLTPTLINKKKKKKIFVKNWWKVYLYYIIKYILIKIKYKKNIFKLFIL